LPIHHSNHRPKWWYPAILVRIPDRYSRMDLQLDHRKDLIHMHNDKILEVKNLKISFKTLNGVLPAIRDVSFSLKKGETLAIVGESGSGKSVSTKAITGLLARNVTNIEGGEILFKGQDLLKASK